MKKYFTLLMIAVVIMIAASCQKSEIQISTPVGVSQCPAGKVPNNVSIRLNDIRGEKKLQNAVACKACHVNKNIAGQL
jgi:hypothetical protein